MKLTEKQKRFCDEYLIDLNATQAAIRAGYSSKTAYSQAERLLKNVEIQTKIQELQAKREKRTEITQDFVLKQLAAIAGAEITDYLEVVEIEVPIPSFTEEDESEDAEVVERTATYKEVNIFPTKGIPKSKIAAIAAIKKGRNGIELKLNDKVRALELIARHLGMLNDNMNISGSIDFGTFLAKASTKKK